MPSLSTVYGKDDRLTCSPGVILMAGYLRYVKSMSCFVSPRMRMTAIGACPSWLQIGFGADS